MQLNLRVFRSADKNVHNIGELDIGTNPNARLTCAVLEDEKVLGSSTYRHWGITPHMLAGIKNS
jgi:leucyl aminopeptidase (aminopeptidase T)